MTATREELQHELADIELALSMPLGFQARQVLILHREEIKRQLRLRRSGWRRWFGRE